MLRGNDIAFEQKNMTTTEKPWQSDPQYFTTVQIAPLALMKMTQHAIEGGDIEIMGILLGSISERAILITDVISLPVEGTETRVNAQAEGYECLIAHLELLSQASVPNTVVGWVHSHPNYGCWLSGIDVATQRLNQTYQDPFVAIVVDPHKSLATGRVEIGAFRTFPEGHVKASSKKVGIRSDKIEDYGVHKDEYYELQIEYAPSANEMAILTGDLAERSWAETVMSNELVDRYAEHTECDGKCGKYAPIAQIVKQLAFHV